MLQSCCLLSNLQNLIKNFIKKFITEIPKIIQHYVNLNFDWDGIEDSRIFKHRLEKKKRRIGDVVNEDRRKDTGEKATRIWEWRKKIVVYG